MYAAELNPVLARWLYPRALPLGGEPTAADRQVLADLVHAEQRRDDQAIGVGFGDLWGVKSRPVAVTCASGSDLAFGHDDQPCRFACCT
jgi:hypothetical protein